MNNRCGYKNLAKIKASLNRMYDCYQMTKKRPIKTLVSLGISAIFPSLKSKTDIGKCKHDMHLIFGEENMRHLF